MNQYFENFVSTGVRARARRCQMHPLTTSPAYTQAYELTKPGNGNHHNPPVVVPEPIDPHLHHPESITAYGRTVLWIVAGIMTLGFITFVAQSQRVAYRFRTIPTITAMINVVAAISYLAMATGLVSICVCAARPLPLLTSTPPRTHTGRSHHQGAQGLALLGPS